MPQLPDTKNLDLNAVALARTIRHNESGGKYDAKGQSGEGGAYQFMPAVWKEWAGKYIKDKNAPQTPENQNAVAYLRIKELKDAGLTPAQILSKWNSGSTSWQGKKGVNQHGAAYDVPLYVEKGLSQFQKEVVALGGKTNTSTPAPSFGPATATRAALPQIPPKKPLDARIADTIADVGKGVLKGAASTLYGVTKVGEKIANKTGLARLSSLPAGQPVPVDIGAKPKIIDPKNTAQKVGFGIEQAAEFLVPATKISKAEKVIDAAVTASKLKKTATAAKIAAKGATEAATSGGIRYAQTGGDARQAAVAGLTAGSGRAALATAGAALRAIRLPERMYSTIFKNSYTDMRSFLKTQGVQALQKENPELFAELVQRGAVKQLPNGTQRVNETLAREVLDRGIKGNIKTMANEVVKRTLVLEDKAQTIAAKGGNVGVREPQFRKVLQNISQSYQDVGFGEISKEADELLDVLKTSQGKPSATDALRLRRFLDRMRVRASYESPNPNNLSLSQQNFRTLTDTLRSRLAKLPGMENTMNEYRVYIEALDRLAKEAARRGNNQVIGLIDSVLFGAGSFVNPIVGTGVSLTRKVLSSPFGSTVPASLIQRGVSTPLGVGARGAAGASAAAITQPR
jgi:hypothetical protein